MKKFFFILGIDRAVAVTLVARAWSSSAGLITLWFIARYLSPVEQGFYYAFASILALQIMFELGMSYVMMQFASHEMINLRWGANRILEGDGASKSRMRSILVLVAKWYGAVGLMMILLILPAGWFFFASNIGSSAVDWQFPWIWLIFMAALNIILIPIFSIFEGCGRVAEVAQIRMIQGMAGSLSAWAVFAIGGGLFAMPVMNTAMVLVALVWLSLRFNSFFIDMWKLQERTRRVCWKTEIWPFQWKIGLSWLSGYFIFQLFVPVLFSYWGAAEAGQMGMSLSIAGAISAIAMAWVNTKAPTFGSLVALRQYDELDALFWRVLKQSTFVVLMAGAAAIFGKYVLVYLGSPFNSRLLPTIPLCLLIITTAINHIIFAQATYLRAHKAEPFMLMSITNGVLVCISTFLLGSRFGSTGMMLGYFVITVVVGLGWGSWIFFSKRIAWHSPINTDDLAMKRI